jgi:hypothetical protein
VKLAKNIPSPTLNLSSLNQRRACKAGGDFYYTQFCGHIRMAAPNIVQDIVVGQLTSVGSLYGRLEKSSGIRCINNILKDLSNRGGLGRDIKRHYIILTIARLII